MANKKFMDKALWTIEGMLQKKNHYLMCTCGLIMILITKGGTETHNVRFILCAFPDLLMNQTFPLAYALN